MNDSHPGRSYFLTALLLTLGLVFGMLAIDGRVCSDIDFSDEGFLWYGARAIKAGIIPIRDFQAYDPGRYVWVAAWSYVLGDSMLALRIACCIFASIGITLGLLALRRVSESRVLLVIVAVTYALWVFPRYKVFEQAISLAAIYVAVRLIERPTVRQHFLSGIFVGLMAFMGRNHGAYLLVAFGLLLVLLARNGVQAFVRSALAWGGGIFIGYLPQLGFVAFAPGFLSAYAAQLAIDVKFGTNLAAAVPWPWEMPEWLNYFDARADYVAEGILFVALLVFLALAALRFLIGRRALVEKYPAFIAASCVALPYTHYAFSRPDIFHLGHSVPAMTLGAVALAGTFGASTRRWLPIATALALLALTAAPTIYFSGIYSLIVRPADSLAKRDLGGQTMLLPEKATGFLDVANHIARENAKADEGVLFIPHMPGLYPATNRFSPIHPIYLIYPATPEEETQILADLQRNKVRWIMLQDEKLDGREDLRFRNTHPGIWRYIEQHFEERQFDEAPDDISVFQFVR